MFEINGKKIGVDEKPYIIAELSANHGGKLDNAKLAIKVAKESGASAVKIQTYTPDTMTINSLKPDFIINDGIWKGQTLYDVYNEAYTPFEWHKELFRYAREIEITLFSSPFDETAVDLLQELNAPAYKIASFELIDLPLIKRAAECGKPLLMSTGMASVTEVAEALDVAIKYGCGDVLLFHCISSYPAEITDSNLKNIVFLRKEFGVEVGLSDHTISNLASTLAVGLGATAIEKHFKPTDGMSGPDTSFSISPSQLSTLVNDCSIAWDALGRSGFYRSTSEKDSRKYRRSLYFMNNLRKGDVVHSADIRAIRPGFGLSPKHFDTVVGKAVCCDVERGDPVTLDVIES
ncbi:pseudaminic acid synthase [Amylibacter sp.]|nr:pseudaminic acid synthase [Amylibacter sp.]